MGRDYYLPRPQWQPDRLASAEHTLDNRYHHHEQPSDVSRPISIERALREQCKIPAQCYFVAAILESGETVTFSGPTEYKEKLSTFFDMNRWIRCAAGQSPSAGASLTDDQDAGFDDYQHSQTRSRSRHGQSHAAVQAGFGQGLGPSVDYEGRRGMDRRRMQGLDELDEDLYRNRKRARANNSRRGIDMTDDQAVPVRTTQPTRMPVQIGDQQAVWNIYDQRFRGLQQTACKLIAKAWVKLVEPKKQSTHPYTGSDEKAPDWWPKPWGPSREEKVRHKEPDHLYKKERVHLLKHILRMIVLPNAEQHPDIQKLHLNVAKLEEATNEVLSSFFADKDAPNNAKKRPYLKEIFLLAKNEEKFRNGEIDGTTNVYVMTDDKIPDNYQSDNEESSPIKDDEEQDPMPGPSTISPHRPGVQTLIAPARVATGTVSTNVSPGVQGSDHSPSTGLPSGAGPNAVPFMGELPHRNHPPPYSASQMLHPDIGSEQHTGYVDSGGITVGSSSSSMAAGHGAMSLQEMLPNPHEASRRSSVFSPTAEYGGATTSTNVYQPWPQSSTAASTSPLYAFPPQQGQAPAQAQHGSFVSQTSVPLPSHGQGYIGQSFEHLPRNTYDSAHDSLFRPGNVTPGAVNPQAGYPMHLAHPDARSLPGHGLKVEPNNRGHLH